MMMMMTIDDHYTVPVAHAAWYGSLFQSTSFFLVIDSTFTMDFQFNRPTLMINKMGFQQVPPIL